MNDSDFMICLSTRETGPSPFHEKNQMISLAAVLVDQKKGVIVDKLNVPYCHLSMDTTWDPLWEREWKESKEMSLFYLKIKERKDGMLLSDAICFFVRKIQSWLKVHGGRGEKFTFVVDRILPTVVHLEFLLDKYKFPSLTVMLGGGIRDPLLMSSITMIDSIFPDGLFGFKLKTPEKIFSEDASGMAMYMAQMLTWGSLYTYHTEARIKKLNRLNKIFKWIAGVGAIVGVGVIAKKAITKK
ncbi:MAG: hypothetical protein Harvfovirus18_8 [Harvfovirus sp.]|uniref:Uncharacterized protein n=1 Tax=Harvfovirus sp. TaxID=2487768 RepID=A0A3G5A1Z0_9VIRU|nr:MAG: hypothetical protein Harvfovirus18_8 [Harvfovirus sp.]